MRITAVRKEPLAGQTLSGQHGEGWQLRIETDSNLVATVPCAAESAEAAAGMCEALFMGDDPRATVSHWERMQDEVGDSAQEGDLLHGLATLDIALWDLKSKANNEPLWRMLGGVREGVLACACLEGASQLAQEEFESRVAPVLMAHSFHAVLVPLPEDAGQDLQGLERVRNAFATSHSEPELLISFSGPITPEQAVDRLQSIEAEFDLACVMAPERGWQGPGLRRVSENVAAAVCAGPDSPHPEGFFLRLNHGDVDTMLVNPANSGITGSLQLAEAAYGYELPVMLAPCHGSLGAQLASAMPNVAYLLLSARQCLVDLPGGKLQIVNGYVTNQETPGVGYEDPAEEGD